jgi:hypothetical protein
MNHGLNYVTKKGFVFANIHAPAWLLVDGRIVRDRTAVVRGNGRRSSAARARARIESPDFKLLPISVTCEENLRKQSACRKSSAREYQTVFYSRILLKSAAVTQARADRDGCSLSDKQTFRGTGFALNSHFAHARIILDELKRSMSKKKKAVELKNHAPVKQTT